MLFYFLKQESTVKAVKKLGTEVEHGWGSAIAIDVDGNFGKATNAPVMLWAQMADDRVKYGNERKRGFDYQEG